MSDITLLREGLDQIGNEAGHLRVDVGRARVRGRRILRLRRAATGAGSAAMIGVVVIAVAVAGRAAPPGHRAGNGSPAAAAGPRAEQLLQTAAFGWLPAGLAADGFVADSQNRPYFETDAGARSGVGPVIILTDYGRGPQPALPDLPGGVPARLIPAARVNGHRAYWITAPTTAPNAQLNFELRWQYAPDQWADLQAAAWPAASVADLTRAAYRIAATATLVGHSVVALPIGVAGIPPGLRVRRAVLDTAIGQGHKIYGIRGGGALIFFAGRNLAPSDSIQFSVSPTGQFSSGSTRHPHGVQITQSALMANLAGMTGPAGLDVVPGDRAVSWLPLYHDMGLIGFTMAPLASQLSIDYLTPRDFARRPTQWLNLISRNRGTIAYSPSFGYDLATRRAANQLPTDLDLSSWRHAGIGGDMIRPDVLDRFAATFERVGFDRKAFIPSYGMAEVCLAITFCPHGTGVRTDVIDRTALADGQRAVPAADPTDERRARRFVLCGKVLPGHRLEVRGADGKVLADREVGRIFVAGPSIMPGYFDEPEATREVLSNDGWLDTGDLGYTLAGEVVVTGRAKDLIIVNGRNVWPQDIEWAIEARKVTKNGDAAAFSVDTADGERVVVAVLARVSGEEARQVLARDVAGAVREAIAVDCDVVLVPPTVGLPTTSSGKLSRARTKANYLAGLYALKTEAA